MERHVAANAHVAESQRPGPLAFAELTDEVEHIPLGETPFGFECGGMGHAATRGGTHGCIRSGEQIRNPIFQVLRTRPRDLWRNMGLARRWCKPFLATAQQILSGGTKNR